MWKDFFYYSKGERRAVFVLSLLIVLFMIGSIVLPYFVEAPVAEPEGVKEVPARKVGAEQVDGTGFTAKERAEEGEGQLRGFDPNSADSIELIRLGLSSFVAGNVMKYRAKGGVFEAPEDFAKMYGLTEEKFGQLRPFIRIERKERRSESVVRKETVPVKRDSFPKVFKYAQGTRVDVATADTIELKKIPGIGSGIARRIVDYRNRLGGFYRVEQLLELEWVTPDLMKWFVLSSPVVQKIPVNRVGLDQLRAHPYINFYQAKVILEFRRKQGKIKSLSQLSLYEEFTEKDLERLDHYLSFD